MLLLLALSAIESAAAPALLSLMGSHEHHVVEELRPITEASELPKASLSGFFHGHPVQSSVVFVRDLIAF